MIKHIAGRVFRPLFALLLVAAVALPVSFATAGPAHAMTDCDEIRIEPDPDCYIPPEPDLFVPIPCVLEDPDNNPYGPYCGVLGRYFDPYDLCSPYYCGGPYLRETLAGNAYVDPPTLSRDIVKAIGVYETNRGGDVPIVRESELSTVAGIKASMAAVIQTTMVTGLTALRNSLTLRASTSNEPYHQYPLYASDIRVADERVTAVNNILVAVDAAASGGVLPDAFIPLFGAQIPGAGLTADNVRTMFAAVSLRQKIFAAADRVARNATTIRQEIDAIPVNERLGLPDDSLSGYIKNKKIWGEHQAAWQRLAVRNLPNNLGLRIEAAITAGSGYSMAYDIYLNRTAQVFARAGCGLPGRICPESAGLQERNVVVQVAQTNNPDETGYGEKVLAIYCRINLLLC